MQCWHCFREVNTSGACPYCGYDAASTAGKYPLALHPGSILNGRYILGHVLGQGGFGITYIAQDYQTKERVAIKEYLPTDFAGRSTGSPSVQVYSGDRAENFAYGMARFLEEAKTLAAFNGDRHIVDIYSYFEENGTAYFCMEYVDGLPLDKYMASRGGRLSPAEANRLLLPLMESLERVHARGVVHRDIAPDNILVTADGQAKLIDFGAARYSTGEKSKSLDVILKHGFAPKEQYLRRGRQGPWTDVYALAATYYYAITGKVPPEAIERIDEDGMIPPRMLGVQLSAEAEDAIYTAMEVNSADRFQSMGAFHQAMLDASPDARAEEERLAIERKEQEARAFLAKLEAERREQAAREEAERLKREEEERLAREKAEREERERKEREAREAAERKKREEEERRAREKAEREEKERKEREAREEAERKKREAKAEAERLKKEEKERRAREKAARIEKEKQEKAAHLEAKKQAETAEGGKPKKSKLPLIFGAVAVLAAVLFFAFGSKGQPETPAVTEAPVQTAAPTPEPTPDTRGARYAEAEALLADGQKQKAWTAFHELGDFQDAEARADRIAEDMRHANSTPITAGWYHTVGLKTDKTAVSVGFDVSGQCDVSAWTDIVSAAAGAYHTVGLKADGTVVAVGSNTYGQCDVSDWTDIVAIATGASHTVGLKADGTVVAVGRNGADQCLVSHWTDIIAVSAGTYHTVGLKADGTVVAVGGNGFGQREVSGWTDIVAVAAGTYHTVGLKADGTVVTVGDNGDGRSKVSGWTDIVAIAVGEKHTVGLKADGTVVAVGDNSDGRCKVSGWRSIVAVAAGSYYTVGLKSDGTVVATGWNEYGQCDVSDLKDIGVPLTSRQALMKANQKVLAAGSSNTVGLKKDGTVVATVRYHKGNWTRTIKDASLQEKSSDWTDIVSVTIGNYQGLVGLRADGTIVSTKDDAPAWTDIIAVAESDNHMVGLKSNGTVVAAGYNASGQCEVSDWTDIISVAVGKNHTLGLKADGTVVAEGANNYGQCEVSGWTDIVAIAASDRATVGLHRDGTVVAAGYNASGQCEVSDWKDIVAVAAGYDFTVGLKMNGTVVAVGNNDSGQCKVSGWNSIVAIEAGDYHTVGLKANGTVVATGWNAYGQCDVSDWRNIGAPKQK